MLNVTLVSVVAPQLVLKRSDNLVIKFETFGSIYTSDYGVRFELYKRILAS
jgi:hypothetical protein